MMYSRIIQRVSTNAGVLANARDIKGTPPSDSLGFSSPMFNQSKSTPLDTGPVLTVPSFTAPYCTRCSIITNTGNARGQALKERNAEKQAKKVARTRAARGLPEAAAAPTLSLEEQLAAIDADKCPCHKPICDNWMLGMVNLHFPLSFSSTKTEWLVRVKVPSSSPIVLPIERADLWTARRDTELATIQWLRSIGAEVPQAWAPPKTSGTLVYHYTERVAGSPPPTEDAPPPTVFIIRQLAAFLLRLADHPFDRIGSLHPSPNDGPPVVGPLVTPFEDGDDPTTYTTSREMWLARIDRELASLESGSDPAYKIPPPDDRHYPIESWLLHRELRRLVSSCAEMSVAGPTYLRHGDDKGDHYLVHFDGGKRAAFEGRSRAGLDPGDDDGSRITIIDWEMSSAVPGPEAFTIEGLTDKRAYMAEGDISLSPSEQLLAAEFEKHGRADLAGYVRGARKYHLLRRMVGHRHAPAWQRMSSLYQAFGEGGSAEEVAVAGGALYEWRLMVEKRGVEMGDGEVLGRVVERYKSLDRGEDIFKRREKK